MESVARGRAGERAGGDASMRFDEVGGGGGDGRGSHTEYCCTLQRC